MGVLHRPVLLGPVSFLLLAKLARPESQPLDALENLLPVYEQLLCQIDEPCLDRISGRRGLRSIAPSSQVFTVPPSFQITLNAAVGTDLTGVGACRFCSSRGQADPWESCHARAPRGQRRCCDPGRARRRRS